jgi:hypothetical protein
MKAVRVLHADSSINRARRSSLFHSYILSQTALRDPQWRSRRVMQLIGGNPEPLRPGRCDDKYIRAYRLMLLAFAAAGNDVVQQNAVVLEYPHVWHAHHLHNSPDIEHRQILEARLLTCETLDEIARRYDTAPQVVDCYEKLFFHVRDRLDNPLWIGVMIKGGPSSGRENKSDVMTDQERAYVYRLFAYCGGPLVLDAAVSGMASTTILMRAEDVPDTALNQIVRTCAAAVTLRLNSKNMIPMMKLAVRMRAAKAATSARDSGPDFEEWAGTVLTAIDEDPAGRILFERVDRKRNT